MLLRQSILSCTCSSPAAEPDHFSVHQEPHPAIRFIQCRESKQFILRIPHRVCTERPRATALHFTGVEQTPSVQIIPLSQILQPACAKFRAAGVLPGHVTKNNCLYRYQKNVLVTRRGGTLQHSAASPSERTCKPFSAPGLQCPQMGAVVPGELAALHTTEAELAHLTSAFGTPTSTFHPFIIGKPADR